MCYHPRFQHKSDMTMDLATMILACSLYSKNAVTEAMIQVGSQNQPLKVTVHVPDQEAQVNLSSSITEATKYAQAAISQGYQVDIGVMQIPSFWLEKYKGRVNLDELFRPCKNIVIATDILNDATRYCAEHDYQQDRCALSVYKTQDVDAGLGYANQVLRYANKNKTKSEETAAELPIPNFGEEQR